VRQKLPSVKSNRECCGLPPVRDEDTGSSGLTLVRAQVRADRPERIPAKDLQRHAWQWALANCSADGSLPSGKAIARQFGRHERWGRLIKRPGQAGAIGIDSEPGPPRLAEQGHFGLSTR
jgi:hypothetical protein